jgi:hypothetical protein
MQPALYGLILVGLGIGVYIAYVARDIRRDLRAAHLPRLHKSLDILALAIAEQGEPSEACPPADSAAPDDA